MEIMMSAEVADLFAAYVAAQSAIDNVLQDREVEIPIKDRSNPGQFKGKFRYRYSTLPGILNHIRKALTDNGLWYTQFVRDGEMVTRIIHKSGQWMDTGNVPLPDIKGSPQDIGAIISYFRRYSLVEAMALASEEDNDGENASEVSFKARGAPRSTSEPGDVEEPEQGWGDWARGLIRVIQGKETSDELDQLRDANKRLLNAVRKVDVQMYEDIGRAFTARRSVVDKNAPI